MASLHRFRILSYELLSFSRNTDYRRERAILPPAAHLSPPFSCSRIQDSAVIQSSCITLTQTAEETKKLRAVRKAAVWTRQGEKGKITDRRSLVAQIQKGKKKEEKHNKKRCNTLKEKDSKSVLVGSEDDGTEDSFQRAADTSLFHAGWCLPDARHP